MSKEFVVSAAIVGAMAGAVAMASVAAGPGAATVSASASRSSSSPHQADLAENGIDWCKIVSSCPPLQ